MTDTVGGLVVIPMWRIVMIHCLLRSSGGLVVIPMCRIVMIHCLLRSSGGNTFEKASTSPVLFRGLLAVAIHLWLLVAGRTRRDSMPLDTMNRRQSRERRQADRQLVRQSCCA